MSTDLTRTEQWALRDALDRQHDHTAKQRAITERGLVEPDADTATLTSLARYEELDLAAIDSLRSKLLPGWMQ